MNQRILSGLLACLLEDTSMTPLTPSFISQTSWVSMLTLELLSLRIIFALMKHSTNIYVKSDERSICDCDDDDDDQDISLISLFLAFDDVIIRPIKMFIKLLQISTITFHINWHALMNQLSLSLLLRLLMRFQDDSTH